jgi:hypothetical protein
MNDVLGSAQRHAACLWAELRDVLSCSNYCRLGGLDERLAGVSMEQWGRAGEVEGAARAAFGRSAVVSTCLARDPDVLADRVEMMSEGATWVARHMLVVHNQYQWRLGPSWLVRWVSYLADVSFYRKLLPWKGRKY